MNACTHEDGGKEFPQKVVREMLRAMGVEVCETCFKAVRIYARYGVIRERGKESRK